MTDPAAEFRLAEVLSYPVSIYVAGDLADARRACRRECFDTGLCVTVTPTEFIYTGGAESGVCVGLVNYPRFPSTPEDIWNKAVNLARSLIVGLSQHSALIQASDKTLWITRRPAE